MNTSKSLIAAILLCAGCCFSCNNSGNSENESATANVFEEILMKRHSVRLYSDRQVGEEQLLQVLWAANGVNREDGKRTAPSCINAQDIEQYLCLSDGTYHYLPQEKKLEKISDTDIRPLIAGRNTFILNQPTILLVSNQEKFARFDNLRAAMYSSMDAGYVSQNICLYCTANGLATVPCAPPLDDKAIREALNLPSWMLPLIYHPIGWEK